ncbi:response regulator transcription factor [Protaetiibacter intestinalis]|uniref:Response regulator n=1 Tax=Protaetiibacter intestinalis TaxID=2419774 RepID=A0A387B2Z1_9MICO|nr:response regulator [Protaetiibacter intestinalis]AYF97954.1 response regulator [Protaetiibacter intestinalis]
MSDGLLALVVDDSDDQAELLRRYLERAGCRVVTASSAERALELLDGLDPALAVIDLVLPGISGEELAGRLRESHPGCLLAITSVLDASRYPEADAVLPKPFTGAQLARVAEQARRA